MHIIALNEIVELTFDTYDSSNASVTMTTTSAAVKVYPKGSTTERTSSNGITLTKDLDTITGVHKVAIDTSDDTDSGFWKCGSTYTVVITGLDIDGQTVNTSRGEFQIDNRMLCEVDVTGQTITDELRCLFETDTASAVSSLQGKHNSKPIIFHPTSSLAGEQTFVVDSKQYGTNELLIVAPLSQAPIDGDLFYLG